MNMKYYFTYSCSTDAMSRNSLINYGREILQCSSLAYSALKVEIDGGTKQHTCCELVFLNKAAVALDTSD